MSAKRKPIFIGVIFFFLFLFRTALAGAAPTIERHDLTVKLYPDQSRIVARDQLTVVSNGEPEITLALSSALQVTRVAIVGRNIPFLFRRGRLIFSLPAQLRNRNFSVAVHYRGTFHNSVPSHPTNTEDPSYGVNDAILPQGVFLSGGSGWYPNLPGAEARYRVRIEVPEGFAAITAGRRLDHGVKNGWGYSIWECTYPLPALTLSAGPFQIRQSHLDKLPIYTYFYAKSEGLSATYLAAAKKFLQRYQKLFGPYPFEKFAIVENFFPTGYGFPSWTLLGSAIIGLPFIVNTSLGHEIAHSWWGNGVRVDYSLGNWSEGLTTYVADYLDQELSSAAKGRAYRLKILRDYATLVPPGKGFPLADFTSRTSAESQAIGYGKGAMLWHMARLRVGDTAFWAALRQVARTKLFRQASWNDFATALGEKGHCDMGPFFRQWVQRPGAPVLQLNNIGVNKTENGWSVHGSLVQKPPYFDIRVPIHLETEGEPATTILSSHSARTPFTINVSSPPKRLQVDPGVTLFRRLDPSEIPPMVNSVRGSRSLLAVATGTLTPQTLAAAEPLLQALGQKDIRIVEESKLSPDDLRGHDVIYFGIPENSGFLGKTPAELHLSKEGFTFKGQSYHAPEDALFAVLPHPNDPDRVAAVFLPLSPEAARRALRKIPHYGKYSALVFRQGINQAKATWQVTHSPLIYDFAGQ